MELEHLREKIRAVLKRATRKAQIKGAAWCNVLKVGTKSNSRLG